MGADVATSVAAAGSADRGFEKSEVVLDVRDDATLHDVLEQLKQERGRAYDPVNFAFERLDDGIRQRVDLDMLVKQLRSNTLTVVRKDAPVALSSEPDPFSPGVLMHRLADMSGRQLDSLRRPPPSAFFFNEYTASIATEYFVTVTVRGSRSRPCECHLVVDRERLYHQPPRGSQTPEASSQKKSSLSLLKKFVKPWGTTEGPAPSVVIFAERRVCDVRRIACDEGHQRGFSVVYGGAAGSSGETNSCELVYQAHTPTECAEIVARVQFLQTLSK